MGYNLIILKLREGALMSIENAEKKGIAIAGNIIVDIINIIEKYPEKNMLTNVKDISNVVGGCVCNTIIDIAKMDPEIKLTAIGKVGNDDQGRFVTSQMKDYGIDVSGVVVSDTLPTSRDYVMSEEKSGERTFFYASGANGDFGVDDVDEEKLDCKIFHAGYILLLEKLDEEDEVYGTKMARLLDKVSKKGIKTSIDVVSSETGLFAQKIIPALKYCDYAILNEIESCKVTGLSPRNEDGTINEENIKTTMEAFIKYGVKDRVIIHCCEAGFMLDAKGNYTVMPSLSLPSGYIKGSVCAGDAYAAACLYGLHNDYDGEKLLEFASCAAACSLSQPDAISGMRGKDEVIKLASIYPKQKLNLM
jgi:sugar/nucleoside kinase (ribokinase family)